MARTFSGAAARAVTFFPSLSKTAKSTSRACFGSAMTYVKRSNHFGCNVRFFVEVFRARSSNMPSPASATTTNGSLVPKASAASRLRADNTEISSACRSARAADVVDVSCFTAGCSKSSTGTWIAAGYVMRLRNSGPSKYAFMNRRGGRHSRSSRGRNGTRTSSRPSTTVSPKNETDAPATMGARGTSGRSRTRITARS